MSYTYTIRFRVRGNDHQGYCSGAEADEENEVDFNKKKVIENVPLAERLDTFDHTEHGCTSARGSKYCTGFARRYKAVKCIDLVKYKNESGNESGDEEKESESGSESGSESESESGSESEDGRSEEDCTTDDEEEMAFDQFKAKHMKKLNRTYVESESEDDDDDE